MNLKATIFEGVDWIRLAQDRDERWGSCEHVNETVTLFACHNFLVPEYLLSLLKQNLKRLSKQIF
jgi:hypothetical protein